MSAKEKLFFALPETQEAAALIEPLVRALQSLDEYAGVLESYVKEGGTVDRLSDYWQDVVRDLEENAPCCFFVSLDSTAAWVIPRLSNRVTVVPVFVDDHQEQYERLQHLVQYCNAAIALDGACRQRLIADFPALAPRIAPFPLPDPSAEGWPAAAASAGHTLVQVLRERVEAGVFRRNQNKMNVPEDFAGDYGGTSATHPAARAVNRTVIWPDRRPDLGARSVRSAKSSPIVAPRIVVGVTSGRISGVDIFAANLVRELRRRGRNAEILQTMPGERTPDALAIDSDVPVKQLQLPLHPTWQQRWSSLIGYLQTEPTVYLPNYDDRHSCIAPRLPSSVKVLGIAHSDDPHHYEHIARLAPYWDAVVAVSDVIAAQLGDIVPLLADRIDTIPYGIDVPATFHTSSHGPGEIFRAVYAGRVVQYQKRAFDLIGVAEKICSQSLPVELSIVGTGEDSHSFQSAAAPHFANGVMRWIGGLPNEHVIRLLRSSHAFVLPSRFEGLPVSLLEAMANGCVPIVTSFRSGVPDVVKNGENGFIVPIADADAIVDAIRRLADDESLRARMARAAYETVRDSYTTELMTSRYMEVIDRVSSSSYLRPAGKILPPASLRGMPAMMPALPLSLRKVVWRLRDALK